MKKIQDIINRLLNVCGQMEVGALLTCRSGIIDLIFEAEKIPAIVFRAYILTEAQPRSIWRGK